MRLVSIFAEADLVSPQEVTWLKFIGILLMVLWVTYLIKEIFFPHKRDPLVDGMFQTVGALTTAMAAMGARIEAQEKRIDDSVRQQRDDVKQIFERITEWNESVQKVLREHEHDIAARPVKPR